MSEPDIPIARTSESLTPSSFEGNLGVTWSAERSFLNYYRLNEQPFGVTPDPRFLYLGPKHRQALAALNYGTDLNRGFLTLIAKPGMGKTSLLFQYLNALQDTARTAFLFQTIETPNDLMRYLLADIGLDGMGKDLLEMHAILNRVLLEDMNSGKRFVIVIDEAQNLDEKVLESVRTLSNFETPWMKLIQIVLSGQPQLAEKLAQPSMSQLRQRISFSIRIEPLNREEVDAYIDHRLWVAGYNGPSLFSPGARRLIAENSEGIPRNISNMCFCAMSLAWATNVQMIDREMMQDVIADLNPEMGAEKIGPVSKVIAEAEREPIQIDPPNLRTPVLTVKDTPDRNWIAKAAISAVVLLALGWSGIHFNLAQRLVDSFHSPAPSLENSIVPARTAPAPSQEPKTATGSENSQTGAAFEAPKTSDITVQDRVQPIDSSQGLN